MAGKPRSEAANDNGQASPVLPNKECPICGRAATRADAPFCSPRCADVDLNRWLGGVYRVEAEPSDDHEDSLPDTD